MFLAKEIINGGATFFVVLAPHSGDGKQFFVEATAEELLVYEALQTEAMRQYGIVLFDAQVEATEGYHRRREWLMKIERLMRQPDSPPPETGKSTPGYSPSNN
jgi:hypothetical protein